MIISIDFDGTIAKTNYPEIVEPIPGAIRTIEDLHSLDYILILNTLRECEFLEDALSWLNSENILYCFSAINNNTQKQIDQWGNNPRKIAADHYIDDRAIGWRGWYQVRQFFCLD